MQAQAALSAALGEIGKGSYVEPSAMMVGEFLQRWLDDYVQHNCAAKTGDRYAEIVRNHVLPVIGCVKLSSPRRMPVVSARNTGSRKGVSWSRSISRRLCCWLSATINFAGFIRRHPELPKVRLHDLRHTHASLLLQAGEHAKVVSERLGHSSVAFTLDTYGHLMPGMEAGAAAKLDGLFGPAGRNKNR